VVNWCHRQRRRPARVVYQANARLAVDHRADATSDKDVEELLGTLATTRYAVTLIVVTCSVDVAFQRALAAYSSAQQAWTKGQGNGGRSTSMEALTAQQKVITHLLSGDVDGMAGADRVITVDTNGPAPLIVGHRVAPSVTPVAGPQRAE
jgi:hypothetical protein